MRWPSREIVPAEASSSPATSLRSVVLPQPEGPSNTQNFPSATSKEISSSTFVPPNDFERFWIESEATLASSLLFYSETLKLSNSLTLKPLILSTLYRPGRQSPDDPALKQECQDYERQRGDRKSTRLNSSHSQISYAVFCF